MPVHGTTADGFEIVRNAFEKNFSLRDDVGASFSVACHGEKVVDLWDGVRDLESGDPFAEQTMAFSFGFELPSDLSQFGLAEGTFAHTGRGQSTHGAWPEHRVGFSYCMNQMRWLEPDLRAGELLAALYECLPVGDSG